MTDRTPEGRRERIERSLTWLRRYEPLLDDPAAFRAALDEPAPSDLLVLPGRLPAEMLAASLARRGLLVERVPAAPLHLRVAGAEGTGALPEVLLGFAYPQGVASAIGPQALAPRSGQLVLDMCAAPGGKTVLLDALAGGAASLLAGENNVGRAGILVQSLARCGVASALVVQQDAQAFPAAAPFERILLDAPCTGEGTFRVPSPRYDLHGAEGAGRVAPLQRRLLARALDLLAPGGRLVYSTCAYAPEENEAVIDEVLAARDDVSVLPLPPDAPGLAGLAEWLGRAFRPDLRHARRLLPHHLGSWGFFVALLEKDAASRRVARDRRGPEPTLADDPEARSICLRYLGDAFGVTADDLAGMLVVPRGRDVFLAPASAARFDTGRLRLVAPGLRFVHRTGKSFVATNAALRWLGPRVRHNVVDLTLEQGADLILAGRVAVPAERPRPVAAVRVAGVIAGKGSVRDGHVVLDLPAGWR